MTLANGDSVDLTPSYGLRSAALQFTAGTKTFAFATWTGPIPNGGGTRASGFMTLSDTGVPDGFETGFGFNPGSGYDGSEWFDAVTGNPVELTVTGGGASGTGTDTTVTILPNRAFELVGGSWTLTGTNDGLRGDQDFAFTGNGISGDTQGIINLEVSGEIDGATLALQTAGTGYTTPPTVTFADDFHIGPNATAETFINGSVTSLNILQPGSGYTPAATINITPGAGAVQAQADPRLSQVVGSISLNQAGENYNPATTSVELEVVSGGIGAVVSPVQVDNGGGILGINVSTPGIDYVTPPTVVINDLSGAGVGATADALLGIGLVVVDNPGAGYTPGPITATVTASPTGANATVSATVNSAGEIDPSTITFTPGTGYVSAPTVTFAGGGTPAAISAYMQVVEINVTAPGEDYDATQTVVELVTAGSGAKAIANLDGSGALASVTMVSSGSGYTVEPIVRIDGYGSGAVAAGNIIGGVVDSTTITQPGSNYAVPPVVTFDPSSGGVDAEGNAIIGNIATVSGNRLSWTALETPISAFVSQFNTIEVNLTGTGDLLLEADAGSLTIEGASTKDGSVTISAPTLTIAGGITVGDYNSSRDHVISLSATAGDLAIDAQVGNLLEGTLNRTPLSTVIQLSAVAGGIITNNSSGPGLLVSESLSFSAQDSVLLNTDVNSITSGVVSDSRANMAITQTTLDASGDVLDLTIDSLTAAGGIIEVIGGANIELDIVDAGTTGAIELAAGQDIKESSTGDSAADIIANSVLLYATTGNIDLDSEVAFLTAAAAAGSVTISQSDPDKNPIDGVTDTLEILRILSRDAITIDAASPIKANYIEATNGGLTLTTDNALHTSESFDVQLGNVASPQFINVEADGSVSSFEPDFSEPVITPPAPPPPVAPAFSITFDFDASLPASVANASNAAGLRWSEIIVGDLNPFVDTNTGDVIDDIEIRVQPGLLGGGDAPGGTLANARPLAFRSDTGLPYLGEVGVDLNDINNPELVAIMIHEFGHALGMPGASSFQTFIVGDYFTGPNAVREYGNIFGASADTNGVPLETGGGGGTAGAHWSEAEFGNELMTGFLGATNLISTVTVGAFEDVGYVVDYAAADPYTASSNVHGISSPDMSGLRPCGCAFCIASSLSSSSLEQEQVITTPTLRVTATGTGETIDIHTDVTTFAGSADGNITIQEANTISLGETTPGSLFRDVVSTSGSITVTAAGRITANDVQATDPTNGALNFTSTGSGVTLGAINTQTTTVNTNGDVSDVVDLKVSSYIDLVGGDSYTPSTTIPITFSASPTGDTATGSATSNGSGVITGITITNPGSGYTTTPTIVIDEPTTGTRATATAFTTGGNRVITSPTLVVHANGSPILLGTNSHVVDTLSATSDIFTRAAGTTTLSSTGDADFVDSVVIANGASGYSPNATNIPVTFEASPTGDTATGYAIADAGGVVTGVTITSPGFGYVTAPTITFASTVHALARTNVIGETASATTVLTVDQATASTNIVEGIVTAAAILNPGSGYTLNDTIPVTFEASPTGDTATGTATSDSNGVISSITITSGGSGYTTAPSLTIDPPTTSPVGSTTITNPGSGYTPDATNIPVTFEASPTGDTATGFATADANGEIVSLTVTNPGSGYETAPSLEISAPVSGFRTQSATVDFSGSGYTPLANIPVTFEASPTSDTTTGYATANSEGEIVSLTITHSGSGYGSAPLVVVDPPATSGDSLLRGNIEFKTTNGLIIDTVVGKEISLTADDTVTDLNYIIGDALTVTSLTGKDITLANLDNQIAAFGAVTDDSAGTKGDVTLTSTLQNVTLTGITADNIDILVYGNVNDSDATDGTALSIVAGGTVELDTATNDIDTLSVVDTAVDTVTINNGGSGYTPGAVAVTFAPPPITNIVISVPGSSYALNDNAIPVTFDASPTGDTATGLASSNGTGQITSVTMTNPGSGYTSTPNLIISAPSSGARAEASISDDVTTGFATADSNGEIVSITITNPGSGYLSAPSLVIDPPTSGTQATATATNLLSSAVTFVDADNLDITGLVAGAVTLQTATQLTQSGAIQTGTLSVTSGATLNLTNTENDADVISITNTGFDATVYDIDDLQIGDPGITANNVVFEIAGDLTQESSSSVLVTDLRVIGSRGAVGLTSTTNEIATISVAGNPSLNQRVADVLLSSGGGSDYTPSQTDIPVVFDASPTGDTATGYATADAAGIITSITVTNSGSGYDSASPPTATVTAPADSGGSAPTVSVVLADHDITIVNSTATDIGTQGLQSAGGTVTITSAGALTQSGDIVSESLSATSDADIVLTNAANNVDDFSGTSTSGNVSYSDLSSVNIAKASGTTITLNAQTSLTQTGAITGTALKITGASDATFTSLDNDVDTLEASGIYSKNSNGFGLEYVDKDDLTVDGVAATAGSISITSGDTLTIDSTVVAGTVTANDGDILLEAQDGNLIINADITAEADRVTLKATAGQINHNSGTITTETLIWYATVSPTFGTLVYSIEGPNLTGPGDLIIDRAGSGTVEIAGASVVDGNVSIIADSLILSELVRAAGTGNNVVIQTNSGSIDIQASGRLESESGDITVAAATDFIVSNHALDGNGDPTVVTATATTGTFVVKKPTATATATLTVDAVNSVTVDFGGLGYTPPITPATQTIDCHIF